MRLSTRSRAVGNGTIAGFVAQRIVMNSGLRHDLLTECRILLLHGLLHLLGWDHELGPLEADSMAAAERQLLAELGWQGDGLVGSASAAAAGGEPPAFAADGEVSRHAHAPINPASLCVRCLGICA